MIIAQILNHFKNDFSNVWLQPIHVYRKGGGGGPSPKIGPPTQKIVHSKLIFVPNPPLTFWDFYLRPDPPLKSTQCVFRNAASWAVIMIC
jgi:hypothetical protein